MTTTKVHTMRTAPQFSFCNLLATASPPRHGGHFAVCNSSSPRRAFTLVELLVVIVIIGILAALITVAAVQALKVARRTSIKADIDEISTGFEEYKNKNGSYPPNAQTDDTSFTPGSETSTPIDESQVLADLKRHLKQAYPRHREPEALLKVLAGLPGGNSNFNKLLAGGMSAGEAVVFWLGGFSADPKYPISGEGGPSYPIQNKVNAQNRELDPIESRSWVYPFAIARLAPRGTDGFFDESDERFIEYTININGTNQHRRINFWQYLPSNSEQPFLYFDVSRNAPTAAFDPPAATSVAASPLHVHALKKISSTPSAGVPIEFANGGKFQILHCGIDNEWDEDAFEKMSAHGVADPNDPDSYLLFPDGPFVGEVADTLTNFTTSTIEDEQP